MKQLWQLRIIFGGFVKSKYRKSKYFDVLFLQEEFKHIKKRQLAKEVAADKKAPGTGKNSRKRKAEEPLTIDSDGEAETADPE